MSYTVHPPFYLFDYGTDIDLMGWNENRGLIFNSTPLKIAYPTDLYRGRVPLWSSHIEQVFNYHNDLRLAAGRDPYEFHAYIDAFHSDVYAARNGLTMTQATLYGSTVHFGVLEIVPFDCLWYSRWRRSSIQEVPIIPFCYFPEEMGREPKELEFFGGGRLPWENIEVIGFNGDVDWTNNDPDYRRINGVWEGLLFYRRLRDSNGVERDLISIKQLYTTGDERGDEFWYWPNSFYRQLFFGATPSYKRPDIYIDRPYPGSRSRDTRPEYEYFETQPRWETPAYLGPFKNTHFDLIEVPEELPEGTESFEVDVPVRSSDGADLGISLTLNFSRPGVDQAIFYVGFRLLRTEPSFFEEHLPLVGSPDLFNERMNFHIMQERHLTERGGNINPSDNAIYSYLEIIPFSEYALFSMGRNTIFPRFSHSYLDGRSKARKIVAHVDSMPAESRFSFKPGDNVASFEGTPTLTGYASNFRDYFAEARESLEGLIEDGLIVRKNVGGNDTPEIGSLPDFLRTKYTSEGERDELWSEQPWPDRTKFDEWEHELSEIGTKVVVLKPEDPEVYDLRIEVLRGPWDIDLDEVAFRSFSVPRLHLRLDCGTGLLAYDTVILAPGGSAWAPGVWPLGPHNLNWSPGDTLESHVYYNRFPEAYALLESEILSEIDSNPWTVLDAAGSSAQPDPTTPLGRQDWFDSEAIQSGLDAYKNLPGNGGGYTFWYSLEDILGKLHFSAYTWSGYGSSDWTRITTGISRNIIGGHIVMLVSDPWIYRMFGQDITGDPFAEGWLLPALGEGLARAGIRLDVLTRSESGAERIEELTEPTGGKILVF